MSARSIRVPVLYCDALSQADGLACMFHVDAPPRVTTVRAMRTYVRSLGWHTIKGGRDICPACWFEGHR